MKKYFASLNSELILLGHQTEVDNQIKKICIFRVGDIISYPNQPAEERSYLEVGTLTYSNGIDFVAEDNTCYTGPHTVCLEIV